ncbi:hypothetical protein Acr_00g0048010 [Actinidia rufa]|uniref:Uncharacterized protein n=1 Tax=Actinidia rufa TaxID=165716 RepID=A0A7J0DJX4_9ERIC|nr:hypothetical protein Acr_00g0048010 [Actinidia rufa]
MDLNQAQLPVHNDAALNEFRIDHGIPDNVQIERPGPNENANNVEGMGTETRSKELSTKLDKGVAIAREYDSAKEVASCLSSFASTSDEEEVPQLVIKRRLSDAPLYDKCKGKQAAEGPSKRHKKKGETSSAFHLSLVEQAMLWKPKFPIAELGKEVTMADTAMDHDTMEARDVGYAVATKAQIEAVVTLAKRDKSIQDLDELQKVAYYSVYERVFNRSISQAGNKYYCRVAKLHPGIYQEGWIACLTELSVPAEHSTWTKAPSEVKLSDFPDPYSPLIMPNFNEEKYMNQPVEEDDVIALKVYLEDKCDGLEKVATAKAGRNGGQELEGED